MKLAEEKALLRIHLSNHLKRHGAPLYEVIVERARREGIAGATVLAGRSGYVGNGPLLGSHSSTERPVIVELVDDAESLDPFLRLVTPLLSGQPVMITWERAQIVRHGGPLA